MSTSEAVPENRIVLTHWEPPAYEQLPADRVPIYDLITAALTYTHVYLKDTDLILNQPLQTNFLGDDQKWQWLIFRELLKRRIVKVLVRPIEGTVPPGVDPESQPITARAYTVRTFKADDFEPQQNKTLLFTRGIDQALIEGAIRPDPVTLFPEHVNPFAVWLRSALESWERLIEIPDFADVREDVAKSLSDLSSDANKWTEFLRKQNRLKPGDEDGKFFRSQVYRILACIPGEHTGIQKLAQSIYNAVYSYWENAAGVYVSDALVEPPMFAGESLPYETLAIEPVSGQIAYMRMTCDIVDAIEETRNTTAFKTNLQIAIDLLRKGQIQRRVADDALQPVVEDFAARCAKTSNRLDAPLFQLRFALLGVAANLVAGIALQGVPVWREIALGASAVCTLAPSGLRSVQRYKDKIKREARIRDTYAFRRNRVDVPPEITEIRRLQLEQA